MKTHEWSPKKRSEALGLMTSRRHSLIEISKIMNISKSTLSGIKKRKTTLRYSRNDRSRKLINDKRRTETHICMDSKNMSLNFESVN